MARRSGDLPGFGAWKSGEDVDHYISNLEIHVADISLQKTAKTARSG
jgi:hypothetical protein